MVKTSDLSLFRQLYTEHMAELTGVALNIKDADTNSDDPPPSRLKLTTDHKVSGSLPFMQKLIAEMLGTYFIVFAGCAALVVNAANDKVLSGAALVVNAANDKVLGVPGISIVWGLVVMVMVYAVGHISGAHFNPAVSIAFAICKRFPFKEVPAYISAQVLGSILANATLRLIFTAKQDYFAATIPAGSQHQAFVVEFIITFYLMFVICAVATDTRAIRELAGLAVGATVTLNAMLAGPISGASMNPARSLGSAIVTGQYKGIWIYLLGPTFGAISGACVYDIIRFNASHGKSTNIDDPDAFPMHAHQGVLKPYSPEVSIPETELVSCEFRRTNLRTI